MSSFFIRVSQRLQTCSRKFLQLNNSNYLLIQTCNYAARRGTRERKLKYLRKMKAAAEARRALLIPKNKLKKKDDGKGPVRILDDKKEVAVDNVWFADMFKIREFTFQEAVLSHRETNHPTIYNFPTAPLYAYVELDMSLDKKTKFASGFTGLVHVKYQFKHGEDRSILAFCKTTEQINEVLDAGVTLAGGADIIKAIKKGRITLPDFQFIIAHPNVAADMISIRGLLRKNFPTVENGMLSVQLLPLIEQIKRGVRYQAIRDEHEPDYGFVNVRIGNLDMEVEHLEDNFELLLRDIKKQAPRRSKEAPFITRCFLCSEPCNQKLKVAFDQYIYEEPKEEIESDDESDVGGQRRATGKK